MQKFWSLNNIASRLCWVRFNQNASNLAEEAVAEPSYSAVLNLLEADNSTAMQRPIGNERQG